MQVLPKVIHTFSKVYLLCYEEVTHAAPKTSVNNSKLFTKC